MDNVVHYIIFWWEQYWGSSWYPYLWAAAFLYLLIFERKRKNTGYLIAFQCLLCFLYFWPCDSCLNPEMYRRSGILESDLALSGSACTGAGGDLPSVQDQKKGPAGGSCNCLCRNSGCKRHQCMECRNYVKVSNHQKVPEEAAQVGNILLAERSAEDSLIAADNSIAPYLRVYDPSFQLAFGRDGRGCRSRNARHLYTRMSAEEPDYKVIGKRARKEKVQFLVLQLSQEQKEEAFAAMEHYGYKWVTAVNDYNIFRFPIAKSGES